MRAFTKGREYMTPDDGSCECCPSTLTVWWDQFRLCPKCIVQYERGYWSAKARTWLYRFGVV